ncbi:Probable ketoamine kinase slr1563 [Geodia barretti]|nr:Probable ketoamine kinase slr1563 [Geodia barretti]
MAKPSFPRLAQDLIALHRTTGTIFGWHRDNYIGGSRQQNPFCNNWTEFFREARLHYQLSLAQKNGYSFSLQTLGEQVLSGLPEILNHHDPVPSLVHGDLWQGNCGFTTDGVPVIYDPAIYYGDRETDLAMSQLFGGFPQVFYDAYREAWPLDPGWEVRQLVYNLYHILNHLNLFGRTYLQQAEATARKILSEIR